MKNNLNTILYGPPGTGKTYAAIAKAVAICDNLDMHNWPERKTFIERFEELRGQGRIEFVTFHQSFAYEEFVEGLRPVIQDSSSHISADLHENKKEGEEGNTKAEGGSSVSYEIRKGVFKRIALKAVQLPEKPLPQLKNTEEIPFDVLWEKCGEKFQDPTQTVSAHRQAFSIKFSGEKVSGITSKKRANVSKDEVSRVFKLPRSQHSIEHGSMISIFAPAKRHRDVRLTKYLAIALTYELYRIQAEISSNKKTPNPEERPLPYVLIIDEINRGNISKIFGELITLLEPDKRLGAENQIRVTLPHSPEPFGVPSNLYIIGTMNTADKSLALLDVALRRRFVFEEVKPDFSICQSLFPEMRAVLNELNRRLMCVIDREHRLGHAFFMNVNDTDSFNQVFQESIVPLLQEFFYNDWEGLRAVLGEQKNGKIIGEVAEIKEIRRRTQFAWWHDLDAKEPDFLEVLIHNYHLDK